MVKPHYKKNTTIAKFFTSYIGYRTKNLLCPILRKKKSFFSFFQDFNGFYRILIRYLNSIQTHCREIHKLIHRIWGYFVTVAKWHGFSWVKIFSIFSFSGCPKARSKSLVCGYYDGLTSITSQFKYRTICLKLNPNIDA